MHKNRDKDAVQKIGTSLSPMDRAGTLPESRANQSCQGRSTNDVQQVSDGVRAVVVCCSKCRNKQEAGSQGGDAFDEEAPV